MTEQNRSTDILKRAKVRKLFSPLSFDLDYYKRTSKRVYYGLDQKSGLEIQMEALKKWEKKNDS